MKTKNRAGGAKLLLSLECPDLGVPEWFLWKKNWFFKNSISIIAKGECERVAEGSRHGPPWTLE